MNNIENSKENSKEDTEKVEALQPQVPKNKVQNMFQELEIMAMQKGNRNSLDLSKLDKEQIDKVLETMSENEKNSFAFHTKRLDAIKEIELRKIEASVINQKTFKVVLIGAILIILPALTVAILFFKETYFIPWLTFLTGILGGFGLSKVTSGILNPSETKNPIKEDESNN